MTINKRKELKIKDFQSHIQNILQYKKVEYNRICYSLKFFKLVLLTKLK